MEPRCNCLFYIKPFTATLRWKTDFLTGFPLSHPHRQLASGTMALSFQPLSHLPLYSSSSRPCTPALPLQFPQIWSLFSLCAFIPFHSSYSREITFPPQKKKKKSDLLQPCLKPFNSSALWGRIKSKQLALWALSTLNLIFLEVTLSSSILSNFSAHKTPWELWAIHTSMLLLMFFSLLNTDSSFKIRFKETHERC